MYLQEHGVCYEFVLKSFRDVEDSDPGLGLAITIPPLVLYVLFATQDGHRALARPFRPFIE